MVMRVLPQWQVAVRVEVGGEVGAVEGSAVFSVDIEK